ncbi:terminase gpA endonuclease subunit [Aliamphritea hakodatensis]|uniref:terminase gpA endonuclease subunit n=1 Tax=Aliamphritea hakodatensis TaxID=2895352 RepID=UPI0022FD6543|nr:terminase gpA endonuclease subunit [Aliamphritea hakodatensis]
MLELQTSELEILQGNLADLLEEVATAFDVVEVAPTIQWLEENFFLPDCNAFYDFYNTPYFLAVALAFDDLKVDEVVLMKAAQIGWTYLLLGYLLKRVVEAGLDPCNIMLLFAKALDGKNFHDEKLVPTVNASAVVADVLDVNSTRKSGNRWDNKSYSGGFLKIVGSNSPGNVKSSSKIGVGVVEEPDDTADNVADQGDAITLLEERLKRAINSLLIVGGTPAIKDLSKTEERLKKTDQRELPIRCHNCDESHVLDWANVHCDKDPSLNHPTYGSYDLSTVIYRCPCCGFEWSDFQRKENIRNTCFDAYNAYLEGETDSKLCGWVPTAKSEGNAVGFKDLSELYVCMEGTTLAKVFESYLEAEALAEQGDDSKKRAFQNQKLGKPYEFKDDNVTAEQIREKGRDYPELIVPRHGVMLTAGVDIQRDRVAIVIRAWGLGIESWCVYWGEIWAHTSINDVNDPVWTALDAVLFGSYRHASGAVMRISAVSLDTSDGVTHDGTYNYVRSRQGRGVKLMGIKGSNNLEAPITALPKKVDINAAATKADKFGLKIWPVGTQAIKDLIAGRMKLHGNGPGRMHHYSKIRADYADQMTGEIKAPLKGQSKKLAWQKKSGRAVEAWDCEVYALHAAYTLKLHIKSADWWEAKAVELVQVDMLADNAPDDLVTVIDHTPGDDGEVTVTDSEVEVQLASDSKVEQAAVPVVQPKKAVSSGPSLAELGRMMNGG